jgi:hypothetical protein
MTAWTLARLRASGEGYLREIGRARVAQRRGSPAPSEGEIREAYEHELGRDAIDLALEFAETLTPDTPESRSGRALLAWLVELEVNDVCAPVDRWLARWRDSAMVRTPDARIVPFIAVEREIARERDRAMRLQLDAARVELLEREVAPTLIERTARERDAIERLAIAGSLREVAERLSGNDPVNLADAATDALRQSADAWQDSLDDRMRRELSISRAEARPADVAAALDASLFDGAFRPSGREALTRRVLAEMGFDPDLNGGLQVEGALRAQGANAECIAVEVPGEIHLIFGEAAGVDGHRSALHALGRATRLGHVEGDAPFEHRWLGDGTVADMCGLTFASVLLDESWMMRHADLSRAEARRLLRITALAALHDLRHACALYLHYTESVDAELPVGATEELYSEIVGNAIGVRPHGVDALLDALPALAPGARLRGMQGASVLVDELVERFDVDWYRNPRAGPWLAQAVLAPACGETAAEMIKAATGRDLSFGPWLRRLERTLAA